MCELMVRLDVQRRCEGRITVMKGCKGQQSLVQCVIGQRNWWRSRHISELSHPTAKDLLADSLILAHRK